jgi:hypothetical protein
MIHAGGMTGEAIAGQLRQHERPEWKPLVRLLGDELAPWFMWMCELELADGARVQAYKHVATRRYVHLADDGRALVTIADGAYRAISPELAIRRAFYGWHQVVPHQETAAAVRAALRQACRTALARCG